jgi:large subunit ribosomal protein L24
MKTGEQIKVIAGKSKGMEGKLLHIDKKRNRVLVEGVNLGVKHSKPMRGGEPGELKNIEMPIHISNVKVLK